MTGPRVGDPAPDFTLPGVLAGERRDYTLSAERGHPVVLAFYPGDHTLGCTRQLCSYQHELSAFTDFDAVVWGISPQSLDSHEGFAEKHGFEFPLLADPDGLASGLYGAQRKLVIKRSTFVIDGSGVVRFAHVSSLGLTHDTVETLAATLQELPV